MPNTLNLTIEETLNSLQTNIGTLTTTLSQMDVDAKISEITQLLPSLQSKVNEIVQMYNDVSLLQSQVNIAKNN
jgi:uncharacterized protein YhaN